MTSFPFVPLFLRTEQRFDPDELHRALILRQLGPTELARRTGLSPTTVYAARAGQRVGVRTAGLILREIAAVPPLPIAV